MMDFLEKIYTFVYHIEVEQQCFDNYSIERYSCTGIGELAWKDLARITHVS